MRPGDGDLVRVRSEGELHAGLYVYVTPVGTQPLWILLVAYKDFPVKCDDGGAHKGWRVIGMHRNSWCEHNIRAGIRSGCLFRLRDQGEQEQRATSTRRTVTA